MFTQSDIERLPYRRGPFTAKIAFVGEAPGEVEEHDPEKRPFIGGSGQLLEEMLRKVGIPPEEVYFSNVIKERPDDKNAHRWIKNNADRYSLHLRVLVEELSALPNLMMVVPVGGIALDAICSKPSIDSWRGSIIPATLAGITGKKCVGIIHPAAILREWLFRPATIQDLKRIKEELKTSEIVLPSRKCVIRPNFEQTLDYINKLKKSSGLISLDLETLPRPQRIVSLQLCDSPNEAICIPFQYKDGRDYWPDDQEFIIWMELVDLLENCGKRLIGQNFLTFDIFMLSVFGFNMKKLLDNVYLDTMEAFECLQPQLPRGLDFLTSVYTREPYYKSEGKEWGTKQGENEFWIYGCKDVMVVSEIAPQLYKELVEENLLEFYYRRFQEMARPRLKMTRRGLRVDEDKRKELELKFKQDIILEQSRLNVLVGENINVKSSPQMQKLLYDKMKLPTQWSKAGTVTCDEDAILALASKFPSNAFKHILTIRNKRTLFSSDISCRRDSDGRIRCSYGFAETGRFRSFACPLGSGSNLQNKTPEMRVMFVPDPGKVFVEMDLSQAEARVVAWAGKISFMMDVFKRDPSTPEGDIHRHTAALIFHRAVQEIGKKSVERYAAKRIVHASNYDMHATTFAKRYNKDAADANMPLISIKDAAILLESYHHEVPELRNNYHQWIQEQIKTTKTLRNPFGRPIIFHDRIGNDLYREGYAWYAQSTIADVTNIVLEGIYESLDIMVQVHDSILVQCWPNQVDLVINKMKQANPVFEVGGMPLSIPMEFKISDVSWGNMKDYVEPKTEIEMAGVAK